jgi:hypothetical protein
MNNTLYEVVESFDTAKDYGIPIRNAVAKCLGSMKKGQKMIPSQFIQENLKISSELPKIFLCPSSIYGKRS